MRTAAYRNDSCLSFIDATDSGPVNRLSLRSIEASDRPSTGSSPVNRLLDTFLRKQRSCSPVAHSRTTPHRLRDSRRASGFDTHSTRSAVSADSEGSVPDNPLSETDLPNGAPMHTAVSLRIDELSVLERV